MGSTVAGFDRNTEAFAGMQSSAQAGLALLGVVPTGFFEMPVDLVRRATFNGCLTAAAHHSGKDDQTIAAEIAISQGYMSRAMRSVWSHWAKRLVAFMHSTNSIVPLQWIADQVGCDVHQRNHAQRERAALLARLRELGEQV